MTLLIVPSIFLIIAVNVQAGHYPVVSHQFFKQDGHGQYTYGYDTGDSSKHESKEHDGVVKGSYTYVDGDGKHQTTSYVADPHHGFNVHATNLPVPPVANHYHNNLDSHFTTHHSYAPSYYHGPSAPLNHDGTVKNTPEVEAARHAHLAEFAKIKAERAHYHSYPQHIVAHHQYSPVYTHGYHYGAPLNHDGTVADTHEVAAAKAAHFAAVADAKHRYKRSYIIPAPLNHDGTVDETPEVKTLKAAHLAEHAKAFAQATPSHNSYNDIYYDESPEIYSVPEKSQYYQTKKHFEPAPLNHDGTVAETPEVKHAKAIHFAAHADAKSKIIYKSPIHYDSAPVHHYEVKHQSAPIHYEVKHTYNTHSKHHEPAPLNHDGTVADTPEIKHAKAIHFAAQHDALQKISYSKY